MNKKEYFDSLIKNIDRHIRIYQQGIENQKRIIQEKFEVSTNPSYIRQERYRMETLKNIETNLRTVQIIKEIKLNNSKATMYSKNGNDLVEYYCRKVLRGKV